MSEQADQAVLAEEPAASENPTEQQVSPAKPKRRWVFLAVAVAAVATAGATVGPSAVEMIQEKGPDLSTPDSVAGLKRDDSQAAKETADYLLSVLRADIDLDKGVSAVYLEPDGDAAKSVMFFGGTTFMFSPERELDTVLKLLDDETGGIKDVKAVDAGSLGGVLKCGSADSSDGALAVCGWADHGSIAMALFPGRSAADAAPLMRDIRQATLKR